MSLVPARGVILACLSIALPCLVATSATGQSMTTSGFVAGSREIVNVDFQGTPVGVFPQSLRLLQGNLEVVDKNGVRMLRASSPSELVINLPETLPPKFTVEVDLIPKACCNPADLMLEGVISGSRSSVSAQLTWKPGHLMVVGGNPQMFQMDMPEAISATLPSALTRVAVSFDNETVTMYTNGKRLYTLADRKFVRGTVMRVSLGGQDDDKYAVYLSRLRIADAAATAIMAVPATTTGTATPISTTSAVLVNPTTTGTITPSSGTSGTGARTVKPSVVKCPVVTNFKAVANGPNAVVLGWTPMSSSCQTTAEAAGERLSYYFLLRWRTADSNSCPADFADINTFKIWPSATAAYTLPQPWMSPNFPMCWLLATYPGTSTFDDRFGLEGGEGYSYRLWPVFEAKCENGTPDCNWGSMSRPYPWSDVSVALPLARPSGLNATVVPVPVAPAAPTEVRTAGYSDMIRLRWSPVTGAVTYRITRVQNTGDPEVVVYEGSQSDFSFSDPYGGGGLLSSGWNCEVGSYCEFRDYSVIKGGLYSYRVWALSAPGIISPPSAPVTQRASFTP
jgi:hypothetical protein